MQERESNATTAANPPDEAAATDANASVALPPIEPLTWETHPARERPGVAIAAILVIALFGSTVYIASEEPLWALAAVVVMCVVLRRFFFASGYAIDAVGVRFHGFISRRSLAWSEVRRVEIGSRAAWLSPYRRKNWREYRRGVHLLFGRNADQIVPRLRQAAEHVGAAIA